MIYAPVLMYSNISWMIWSSVASVHVEQSIEEGRCVPLKAQCGMIFLNILTFLLIAVRWLITEAANMSGLKGWRMLIREDLSLSFVTRRSQHYPRGELMNGQLVLISCAAKRKLWHCARWLSILRCWWNSFL